MQRMITIEGMFYRRDPHAQPVHLDHPRLGEVYHEYFEKWEKPCGEKYGADTRRLVKRRPTGRSFVYDGVASKSEVDCFCKAWADGKSAPRRTVVLWHPTASGGHDHIKLKEI